jgi:hypothetical protein
MIRRLFLLRHRWTGQRVWSECGYESVAWCVRCGGEYPGDPAEFPEQQFDCLSLFRALNQFFSRLSWRLKATYSRTRP